MKCYLKIKAKIENLSNYNIIKEASNISNDIIENGINHFYKFNKIEVIIDRRRCKNKRITFNVDKSERNNHRRNLRIHDLKANTEKTIKVYSVFDELKKKQT